MRPRSWVIGACLCSLSLTAFPEALESYLGKASRLIESGQAAEALRVCQEAQVEFPGSAELLFALAYAEAALGQQAIRQHDPEKGKLYLNRARETFGRAAAENPAKLAAGAAYNQATCLLRLDEALDPQTEYQARIKNLEAAIDGYTEVLESHPDLERAQQNLDHARYKLNLLRQNPPRDEPEEEQKDEEPAGVSEVESASTEFPRATAEVIDGTTVVLRREASAEAAP